MVKLPSFRPTQTIMAWGAFAVAGFLCLLVAWASVLAMERVAESAVRSRLMAEGIAWVQIRGNGLQVELHGTAPTEAQRFRVVNLAGNVVENSRLRDMMDVTPARAFEAPKFSLEILRNDDGIQLIGLVPADGAKERLTEIATVLQSAQPLQEMVETADYPAPAGWAESLAFGETALALLPRSKISVAVGKVSVTAIAASEAERARFDRELAAARPEGVEAVIEISAPRPVITPFTLRFVADAEGRRFDACSADTEAARTRILAAGAGAGVTGRVACTVGLGVPTPSWAQAAEAGIAAVDSLGAADITFSDADVTLKAAATVSQADFDRVVGELEAALPDLFSLDAKLERASEAQQGPAEFTAVLNGETGRVELRGRLSDEAQRDAVNSFATALFGTGKVYLATRLDPELPDGWPVRVLAGLQALDELKEGRLLVRSDLVQISGVTGSQVARGRISQVLSDKLGQGAAFRVDVIYDEALDPIASVPTPEECAVEVGQILTRGEITFEPGSAELAASANPVLDALADTLKRCPGVRMEIGGHTDSQGSDEGNRTLSQTRAEAVLLGLQGRQVDVSGLTAKGYGEAVPIADNATEAGRESNRRIEFVLQGVPASAQEATAQGATPAQGADAAAEGPDFSGDTSPSLAPTQKTMRPKPRPAQDG